MSICPEAHIYIDVVRTPNEAIEALIKRYPNVDRKWFESETPRHPVTISQPFYLGIHLVTQAQWEAVMGTSVREQRDKSQQGLDFKGR